MGFSLKVADVDKMFHTLQIPPVIANDIDLTSMEAKEKFNALVTTQYEGDFLSNVPSCVCGRLTKAYNLGRICGDCETPVMHHPERDIESRVWIARPQGVKTLVNPNCWLILKNTFNHGTTNLIEWLCDPLYRPDNPDLPAITKLKARGHQRGFNHFYQNFDKIFDDLIAIRAFKGDRNDIVSFVAKYRDRIFCNYLPIPSRISFVTEKTNTAIYSDPTDSKALEAIQTISTINSSITETTQRQRERIVVKALNQLSQYHDSTFRKVLAKKEGWYRKHIFGSRGHFTYRGVITSLTGRHSEDDVHMPWSLSVNLLKVHLTNKLLRPPHNFTPSEAFAHIQRHLTKYCPILHGLIDELTAESPQGYMHVFLQRNPTLRRGSKQLFRVAKVKTDPKDLTISMSVLTLRAANADFDGRLLPSLNLPNCGNASTTPVTNLWQKCA